MQLESLNRVELKGRIGAVKVIRLSETSMARLSVATNYAYKGSDGCAVIETTWHTVVVWEGKGVSRETIESIAKGDAVHVIGRIRLQKYTDSEGVERTIPEIVAHKLEKMSNV